MRLHCRSNSEARVLSASCIFVLNLAIAVSFTQALRPESGVGADCYLPLTQGNLAPVFGTCERVINFGEGFSFQTRLNDLTRWIILWSEGVDTDKLSKAVCTEASSSDPNATLLGRCSVTYKHVIQGIAIELTYGNLRHILTAYNGSIASVHEDTSVVISDIQFSAPWGLDRIDQTTLPLSGTYRFNNLGSNVHAYIVDTGIRSSHEEFRYIDGSPGTRASEVFTSLTSGVANQDCNGHGTHVAGTVGGLNYGPAKNVTLFAIRALECLGNGTISQVIAGLDWVQGNHLSPAVAVLAFGGDAQYALDLAVHNLAAAGVPVLVAAGNDDTDACLKSPAREPLATTVAATNIMDQRLWVSPGVASNYGSCVKVWAPGTNIQSCSAKSDTATEFRSGTSQAAPFVAGAIAVYLQNETSASGYDVSNAIASWAAYGQIWESPQSSPNGSRVVNTTSTPLLNILHSSDLVTAPSQITLQDGSLGPFTVQVNFGQILYAPVMVDISLSDPGRGSIYPPQLKFDPSNWKVQQSVTLNLSSAALSSTESSPFTVNFLLDSSDESIDGQQPKAWVFDRKGDSFEYPKVISTLPFRDVANTYFFDDTYDISCNGNGGAYARDVIYYFAPVKDCTVNISLCGSGNTTAPIDSVLYLVADLHSQNIAGVSCNDDFCGRYSQLQLSLSANTAYGIIVDSKNNNFGTYQIDITANEGYVSGSAPDLESLSQIPQHLPRSMLSNPGSMPYTFSAPSYLAGETPVYPTPPPPPSSDIGTDPGPPAPYDVLLSSSLTEGSPYITVAGTGSSPMISSQQLPPAAAPGNIIETKAVPGRSGPQASYAPGSAIMDSVAAPTSP